MVPRGESSFHLRCTGQHTAIHRRFHQEHRLPVPFSALTLRHHGELKRYNPYPYYVLSARLQRNALAV